MPLGVIIDIGARAAKAAKPYLEAAAAAQTYQSLREQRKQQKREAALQAQAHADQQAQKSHLDRELSWRLKHRRHSGYGVNVQGGYPTGY